MVCDLHGHGRTSHADRPITSEGMADDAAALLDHLGIARADVVGFSMGGGVAVQLAVRHSRLVRAVVPSVVPISAGYRSRDTTEMLEMIPTITPEMFAGTPFEDTYSRIAPGPDAFPTLVTRLKTLDEAPFA